MVPFDSVSARGRNPVSSNRNSQLLKLITWPLLGFVKESELQLIQALLGRIESSKRYRSTSFALAVVTLPRQIVTLNYSKLPIWSHLGFEKIWLAQTHSSFSRQN